MYTHIPLLLTLSCVLGLGAPASAEPPPPPSSLPCTDAQQVIVDGRRYIACGHELIVRATDTSATLLERRIAPEPIVGLFERGGQVFVEFREVVLRPAASLALVTKPVARGSATVGASSGFRGRGGTGEVVSLDTRSFLVDLGMEDGITEGDHVAVLAFSEQEIAGQQVRTERVVLVGEVFEVAPQHARVRLGMGETTEVGARVRVTTAKISARLINRPRHHGASIGVSLQPFLPINDDLAFATLGDGHVTYRFKAPAYMRVQLGAFGGLVSGQGNQSVFDGWFDAGFDHKVFSIGLGVGALRTEGDIQGLGVESSFQPTLVQTARFGPLDGLNLAVSTRAMLRDKEVQFGAVSASLFAPVHRRTTLVFSGGGGSPALYGFGTVGARFLVRGNGGAGSLFITPAVGYATIKRFEDQGTFASTDRVGGRSLSVGVEWRP
ncbi:MAG: hypothetical protein WBG86_16600 [Polyangiales bacterium]